MKPDEIRHLLGGYATGTLTPEEQQLLFEAALADQDLFDSLMREQALKEALETPAVRRELIAALDAKPSWWRRLTAGVRWPYPVAGVAALAAAAITVVVIVRQTPPQTPVASIARDESPKPAATVAAPKLEARAPARVPPPAPSTKPAQSVAAVETPRAAEPAPQPVSAVGGPSGGVIGGIIGGVIGGAPPPPPPPPRANEQRESAQPAKQAAPREPVVAPAATAADSTQFRAPVLAASTGSPRARELYDQPAAGAARAKRAMPGFRAISPAAVAPLGFRYVAETHRLTVESNADSTLYLFRRLASGDWAPLTPGGLSLKARTPVTPPFSKADVAAPAPKAIAILYRSPSTALAQSGPDLTEAIEQLRRSTAPPLAGSSEGSVYAVSTGSGPLVVPLDIP